MGELGSNQQNLKMVCVEFKEHCCYNCGNLGDSQEFLQEHLNAPVESWVWCKTCELETFWTVKDIMDGC